MGHADYYKAGDNNCICDRCGFKYKASELKRTWDGLWVCSKDWEPRHPQDFVRGVEDYQRARISRPEGPDVFVPLGVDGGDSPDIPDGCTLSGITGIAGMGIAGCMVAGDN